MDFTEQLRVLQAAQGDPVKLALATVDLKYPGLPDTERFALRESLEAAAIPHWCNEAILGALLEISQPECATRFGHLSGLNVLEPFRARGSTAINVHKETRLEIRKRMAAEDHGRFRELSARAAAFFADDRAPATLIEWMYHLLCANPVFNAKELEKLDRAWTSSMQTDGDDASGALDELDDTAVEGTIHERKPRETGASGERYEFQFDVFLCHNSLDKATVRELATKLEERQLSVWLDEWCLRPGLAWRKALEEIIQTTRAAAVLVGSNGIGPWQDQELEGCLLMMANRDLPVIPVLLPNAPGELELPLFLRRVTWVDLRPKLTNKGLDRLQWGITGEKPSSLSIDSREGE